MRLEAGTTLRAKYQILRKVGPEGAGEVFEARHLELAGRYAIKLLCEGGIRNALLLDELRREVLATSALTHPGIARVYDLDQAPDGSPFVVMEFLDGQDLGRVIREAGSLALVDVVALVEAIASPLEEAHRHGIVHGDLTPDNVFVVDAEADPHARVKLLDFGVARIRAQAGGIVRGAPGAAAYLAPERRGTESWRVDTRADVFSLGALAFSMLGGPRLAPPAVAKVVARAMSPQPEARFRSVMDFAQAFRAAVAASPARASGVRSTRLGATPAAAVPTLHRPSRQIETERVRLPGPAKKTLAVVVGCGLAIVVGVVAVPRLTRAPRGKAPGTPPPAAVAPRPMPAAPVAPIAAAPAPVAPAATSTDGARLPLPARPKVHRRRSAHVGMSEADVREMKESYQKATRAFDLSNYDEAIAAYKKAYELGGDAPMLYNIAQALRLSKRPQEAATYYRRYLSRAPGAKNRDEVLAKLAELSPPR